MENKLSKDEWIQLAKALLFDLQYCTDALQEEIREALIIAGGYDCGTESYKTPLRWRKDDQP